MAQSIVGVVGILALIAAFGLLKLPRYQPPQPALNTEGGAEVAADAVVAAMEEGRPNPADAARPGETRRRPTDRPDPTEIVPAPETGIGLGWGWNAFHGEAIPTECVRFVRDRPYTGQTSDLSFTEINDTFELQVAMDMSAEASVKSIGYEVEGEMSFASKSKVSGSSLTYLIEAEVLNAPWIAEPPGEGGGVSVRLTDTAERLARRDLELFKDVCGTGYISATYGGAKLSILAEIKTFSQATRTAMSASVKGSGWGAKVEAAMSGSSESKTDKAIREITYHQSGGQPDILPTEPDEIIQAAKDLAKAATAAEKIFRVAVTPYEVLQNWPREDDLSGSDLEYEQLAALWGSYQALYTDIQGALEAPEAYVVPGRSCTGTVCEVAFQTAEDVGVAQRLKDLQDEIIIWLDRLELASRTCVTAEEECKTDTALYRTPYAYQVSAPVRTCLLAKDSAVETAYEARRKELYVELYGALPAAGDKDKPALDEFRPDFEVPCAADSLVEDPASAYSTMLVEDVAKARCDLGSLTPGCLTNADIDGWAARVGHRSMVLSSSDEVGALVAAAQAGPVLDTLNGATGHCAEPEKIAAWPKGDPGAALETSLWVPSECWAVAQAARMVLAEAEEEE